MKNPFTEKYAVSFIAAAFHYAVEQSTYEIETQRLLEKYINLSIKTDIQDVFEFLREKEFIKENESITEKNIPSHFTLLNEAILWAHEYSKSLLRNS